MHAVCFPDNSQELDISTYGKNDITWWSNDLKDIRSTVLKTIKYWENSAKTDIGSCARLKDLLAPTIQFKRRLKDDIGTVTEFLLGLTEEQVRVFETIQRNRRAVVHGGPGTGKTLLSIERARHLSKLGFKTLWVCYNELLAFHIQQQLYDNPSVLVSTFHSFCLREMHQAGIKTPNPLTSSFWEVDASKFLIEAAIANETSFDAIIVDEGQDFSQDWIDALEILIKDATDPPIYIFNDKNQQLYNRGFNLANSIQLDLSINCRNTRAISKQVLNIIGEPPPTYGAEGPDVIFSDADDPETVIDRIESRVSSIIEIEKINPSQITVLIDDDKYARKLRERYAGPYPFVSYKEKGVIVETIHRFKGLENDVIVVGLTKEYTSLDKELQRLCYVAFSRARAYLLVIGNKKLKNPLNW